MLVKKENPCHTQKDMNSHIQSYLYDEEGFSNPSLLKSYRTIKGKKPILVVVPEPIEYQFTGTIAKIVQRITDCTVIFQVKSGERSKKKFNKAIELAIKKHHIKKTIELTGAKLSDSIHFNILSKKQVENLKIMIKSCFTEQGLVNVDVDQYLLDFPSDLLDLRLCIGESFRQPEKSFSVFQSVIFSLVSLINIIYCSDQLNPNPIHMIEQYNRKTSMIFPHTRIELSLTKMSELNVKENDFVIVMNAKNGLITKGCVKPNHKLEHDEIALTKRIKTKLAIIEECPFSLLIQKQRKHTCYQVQQQDISAVKERKIIVSENIYNQLDDITPLFEVVNGVTGNSFDIKKGDIVLNKQLPDNTIKLSFLQRQFIDYELPPDQISSYYFEQMIANESLTADEKDLLSTYYKNNNVIPNLSYFDREKLKKILKKSGYISVHLYPLFEYETDGRKEPLLQRLKILLAEKFIGQKIIHLQAIRPYSTDESSTVVRMSANGLKLLGVDEADTIVIKNRSKKVTARVLEVDSIDLLRETNIITTDSSMNIAVGIPAHVRRELGLAHIGKVCEVERDLGYLFKKNLNIQFIPMLAAVFTAYSLNIPAWTKLLLTIFFVPLSIYIAFSGVREKISHK